MSKPTPNAVTLKPVIDELCAEDLNQLVRDALTLAESRGAGTLVLDLSEVEFLNSCCLGILIQLKMRLSALPCQMRVTGCRRHVANLFKASRLDEYLGMDESGAQSQVA